MVRGLGPHVFPHGVTPEQIRAETIPQDLAKVRPPRRSRVPKKSDRSETLFRDYRRNLSTGLNPSSFLNVEFVV